MGKVRFTGSLSVYVFRKDKGFARKVEMMAGPLKSGTKIFTLSDVSSHSTGFLSSDFSSAHQTAAKISCCPLLNVFITSNIMSRNVRIVKLFEREASETRPQRGDDFTAILRHRQIGRDRLTRRLFKKRVHRRLRNPLVGKGKVASVTG
jgi:hypothetical protein